MGECQNPAHSSTTKSVAGTSSGHKKEEYEERRSDDEEDLFEEPDELFDEHADSEDEKWVRENLLGSSTCSEDVATVSCPSCFAQLSMQCQQHTRYQNQFRALFVTNCRVVVKESLQVRSEVHEQSEEKREPPECFRPVNCSKCETRVAVLDQEGVYHFFNVVY